MYIRPAIADRFLNADIDRGDAVPILQCIQCERGKQIPFINFDLDLLSMPYRSLLTCFPFNQRNCYQKQVSEWIIFKADEYEKMKVKTNN